MRLVYHSRYALKNGQPVQVFRCRDCRKTFCDRYGTAFYDLKIEEEKVQRAIHQGLEGLCPEAVARIEGIHPTTVQRWVARACKQAGTADKEVIKGVSAENIELDELHSFAGAKHPGEKEQNATEIGRIARWSVNPACCSKLWSGLVHKSRRRIWWTARPSGWPMAIGLFGRATAGSSISQH